MQKENVLRKRDEKGARGKRVDEDDRDIKDGEQADEDDGEDEGFDMYEDEWDSEVLEGDGELEANEPNEGEDTSTSLRPV